MFLFPLQPNMGPFIKRMVYGTRMYTGLKSAGGYLRRELGHALQLRYAPEIVWAEDDSIEYGAKMLKLINSLEVNHDEEPDEG